MKLVYGDRYLSELGTDKQWMTLTYFFKVTQLIDIFEWSYLLVYWTDFDEILHAARYLLKLKIDKQ